MSSKNYGMFLVFAVSLGLTLTTSKATARIEHFNDSYVVEGDDGPKKIVECPYWGEYTSIKNPESNDYVTLRPGNIYGANYFVDLLFSKQEDSPPYHFRQIPNGGFLKERGLILLIEDPQSSPNSQGKTILNVLKVPSILQGLKLLYFSGVDISSYEKKGVIEVTFKGCSTKEITSPFVLALPNFWD